MRPAGHRTPRNAAGASAALFVSGAALSLGNTIVANGAVAPNCFARAGGTITALGGNLSDDASCGFTGTSVNGTNPQLGPLQDNGGPMLPQTGSPSIDQGVNQLAIDAGLTTDQRGAGLARISGSTVDRGAFEVQVPAPAQLTVAPGSAEFGTVPRFALRYRLLTLTNNGSTAVTLNRISVTPAPGTQAGEFTALSFCPATLAAGKSCTVKAVLFAFELGARAATLTIPSSAGGSPLTVPLDATVTAR